jgi:hypothetical protein
MDNRWMIEGIEITQPLPRIFYFGTLLALLFLKRILSLVASSVVETLQHVHQYKKTYNTLTVII